MTVKEILADLEEITLLDEKYDDYFVGVSNDIAVYKDICGEGVITITDLEWSDDLMIFTSPSYNDAIIGMCGNRAVYDYDLMIESLIADEGWTYEESIEWVDYNTLHLGYEAPIVVIRIDNETDK